MPDPSSDRIDRKIQSQSGAAIETFSDLLADAPDLEGVCSTALHFALETIDHSAGVLIVQTPQDSQMVCMVQSNLSNTWQTQLDDPTSLLNRIAQTVLHSGQYIQGRWPERGEGIRGMGVPDLAAAIPIPGQTRQSTSVTQGVLLVQGAPCSPIEIDWLIKLARPLGRAIRMSRTGRSGLQQTKTLASLQETLNNLSLVVDLEKLQTQLIDGIRRLLDAEQTILAILDELETSAESQDPTQSGWITRKALLEEAALEQLENPRSGWIYLVDPFDGQGLLRESLRSREPILVNSPELDQRFNSAIDSLPDLSAHSVLIVPLVTNDHLIGAIQVINKHTGSFDRHDQDLLSLIAGLASNALYSAKTLQRMKIADADREADRWEMANAYAILRALFEHLPGRIYVVGQQYELVAMNLEYRKALAQQTGRQWNELIGKTCYQALYNRSEPCQGCLIAETFKNGRATARSLERPLIYNPVSMSSWEIRTYPIFNECTEDDEVYTLPRQVVQVVLVEQDVSEKRELESVITQSGKLAALGQLAAGVAHEINNPLTAIIANAQILQREFPPGDERLESVELISMAGTRAAQVVRNLLDFARKEQAQHILTDVNDTVRTALALVQHELISRSILLEFEPDEQLPVVLASPDSLQSVWLNLLLNAIESIEGAPSAGGIGRIRIFTQRAGNQVQVNITDNGRGIPKEHLDRIFEPFYTTKPAGRGTGLGLSVCRRIIEQHQGSIHVESHIGVGTEFMVILPIS